MVKATSIDMSLADIISSSKKNKKVARRPAGGIKKRGAGKPAAAGTPRRQSAGIRKAARPARPARRSIENSANDTRPVRINVSNLAPTVVSSDLKELFREYKLHTVTVNFSEGGKPLGTGDITLSKRNADRLVQKFAGIALDGKVMQFAVIEKSSIASRTEFRGPPPARRNSAGRPGKPTKSPKAAVGNGNKKTKKPVKKGKREEKPKKTAEELDAELDAYMTRTA